MRQKASLYKEFGRNILTRNSMASFFEEKVNPFKDKNIIIDFGKIKFISRSCAVEYLKLREESNKNLIEKNMSDEIKSMFDLVVKQLKSIDFVFTKKIPIREMKLAWDQ